MPSTTTAIWKLSLLSNIFIPYPSDYTLPTDYTNCSRPRLVIGHFWQIGHRVGEELLHVSSLLHQRYGRYSPIWRLTLLHWSVASLPIRDTFLLQDLAQSQIWQYVSSIRLTIQDGIFSQHIRDLKILCSCPTSARHICEIPLSGTHLCWARCW